MGLELLVVDDSPVARKMVLRAVSLSGIAFDEVHEAGDGAEALNKLAERRVALVLADLNMPVMSGLELVDRMSRDPALAAIPVVVVATPTSDTNVESLLAAGARAFLPKPFRPEALREVIARVLGATGVPRA